MKFGTITLKEAYKNNNPVSRVRTVEESVPVASRGQLVDLVFKELDKLQTCTMVNFAVYADKNHEPSRVVVVTQESL